MGNKLTICWEDRRSEEERDDDEDKDVHDVDEVVFLSRRVEDD